MRRQFVLQVPFWKTDYGMVDWRVPGIPGFSPPLSGQGVDPRLAARTTRNSTGSLVIGQVRCGTVHSVLQECTEREVAVFGSTYVSGMDCSTERSVLETHTACAL